MAPASFRSGPGRPTDTLTVAAAGQPAGQRGQQILTKAVHGVKRPALCVYVAIRFYSVPS